MRTARAIYTSLALQGPVFFHLLSQFGMRKQNKARQKWWLHHIVRADGEEVICAISLATNTGVQKLTVKNGISRKFMVKALRRLNLSIRAVTSVRTRLLIDHV
jgi:hypothetical protein